MVASALQAAGALVAIVLTYVAEYALCIGLGAQSQPAILAAVIAMTLSRRAAPIRGIEFVRRPLVMAITALAAAGIGALLLANAVLGAALFTIALSASVYLRNFGALGRSIGALVATPLVVMLVIPVRVDAPGGRLADLLILVSAGIVPLAIVSVLHAIERRAGMRTDDAAAEDVAAAATPQRDPEGRRKLTPATRMAVQLGVALAAAFFAGHLLFPDHWAWTVLTAYIVCAGARGRGEAAYKGVQRFLGAAAGSAVAIACSALWLPRGPLEAVTVFAVLYLALWLRPLNYAYWACGITLILALLSPAAGGAEFGLLRERLAAILAGGVCGVAAAWFVLPIPTNAVIRRRLNELLVALDAFVQDEQQRPQAAYRMRELAVLAPPVDMHRRFVRVRDREDHPATWIERARSVHDRILSEQGVPERRKGAIRKAIGTSRRAIGQHARAERAPDIPPVGTALRQLDHLLSEDQSQSP